MRLIIMFTLLMSSVSAFAQLPGGEIPENGDITEEKFAVLTLPGAGAEQYFVKKKFVWYLHPPAAGTPEADNWEYKSPEGTPLRYSKLAPGEVDFTDTQKLHAKYSMEFLRQMNDEELEDEATLTYNCMSYVFGYENVWISTMSFITLMNENNLVPAEENPTISAHGSGSITQHVSNISSTPVCNGSILHFTGKFGGMGRYKTNLIKTSAASGSDGVLFLEPESE